jgi:hypothetical protein
VKFRVKASAIVASTTARPTHWRPVGFYSTAPTGLKFGSRAYVSFGSKADIGLSPLMSAIHPKVDVYSPNVRFVPKADIAAPRFRTLRRKPRG